MIASMLVVDPDAQCDERFGVCQGDPTAFPGWGIAVLVVAMVIVGLLAWRFELDANETAALIAVPFFIGLGIYLLATQ